MYIMYHSSNMFFEQVHTHMCLFTMNHSKKTGMEMNNPEDLRRLRRSQSSSDSGTKGGGFSPNVGVFW